MRLTGLLGMTLLGSFAFAGCGDDGKGGGGGGVDAPKQIDASNIDAAPVCPPATLGALGIGSQMAPASHNWVVKNSMGQLSFVISSFLPNDMMNGIDIIVPRPAAGFAPGTFTFATDPNAMNPTALSFIEGGLDAQGSNPQKILFATNGSITFTSVTKAAAGQNPVGQNVGDTFVGSVSATLYKEIDDNGAPVTGGCMLNMAGLQFNLSQMTAVTAPAPSDQPANWRDVKGERVMPTAAVAQ